MLRLTKKSEDGLIALKHMLNMPEGTVIRAKEIAEFYNIPSEILAKILQQLVRTGLVQSSQGAKGGYILAKRGNAIYLSEIIESLEGPLELVECMTESDCGCLQIENCNISDPFRIIQKQLKVFLSQISLADINNEIEIQKVSWQ